MGMESILRLMAMYGGGAQGVQNNQAPMMQPTPFTGMGMPTGAMSQPPPAPVDDYNPYARIQQLYQPRTTISSQYSDALSNMPQRQPVGIPRGLAAIASSMLLGAKNPALGMQTGDQVAHGPYYQELGDWQTKTGALGKGAAEEDRYNTNQRMLAENTVSKELADRKQESLDKLNVEKTRQGDEKIKNAEARTDIYRQKMEISRDVAKGGKVVQNQAGDFAVIYRDGSSKVVDVRGWTPADIAELKNEYALQQIGARTSGTIQGINAREKAAETLLPKKESSQIRVKAAPGSAAGAGDTSTDVIVRDKDGNVVSTRHTEANKTKESVLRDKAKAYIATQKNSKGLPIEPTEANIKHAIDSGMVK